MSAATTSSQQYLTFFIAGEEYALSILQVTDIIECGALTWVPGAPSWIRGVHNLRGAVVPVVDLAVRFGMPPTEITRRTCIVIVEIRIEEERLVMGVMADSVHHVIDLGPDEIQPPPAFGPNVRIDCILGMAGENKFVLLLDIDKVLSSNEILTATSCLTDETAQPAARPAAEVA
jgi:purine-binding chemotaxis protein CheW